jgi:hypothetical protein
VGFYIMEHLNFKILPQYSLFIPYSFECLTVEVILNNKKLFFSSIYRFPSPPPNHLVADHLESFGDHLSSMLSDLSEISTPSFICLNSNLNLLQPSQTTLSYTNSYFSYGFSQIILKATCIQGNSHSLIGHILTNFQTPSLTTGVLIGDISDHFMTLAVLQQGSSKSKGSALLHAVFHLTMFEISKITLKICRGTMYSRLMMLISLLNTSCQISKPFLILTSP